jgi:hypothetical protein
MSSIRHVSMIYISISSGDAILTVCAGVEFRAVMVQDHRIDGALGWRAPGGIIQ